MPDWLEELRREKQQAMARTRSAGPQPSSSGDRPGAAQELAAIIQQIGIEPLMQQLVDEVLRDHPLFVDPALERSVFVRTSSDGPARDDKESAPWSGPVEGNYLPLALELGDGRSVSRVDWRLHLNYRQQHSNQRQLNDIVVSASAQGVLINSEPLAEHTAEKFKTALVNAFRERTQSPAPPSVRHSQRRRRRWYRRLLGSMFPDTLPAHYYIILIIVVIVILVFAIYVLSSILFGMTLR